MCLLRDRTYFWISVFLVMLVSNLFSCTREITLNTTSVEPRLVVEGNVFSTPGPYLVRLSLSRNALNSFSSNNGVTPVTDALVIISDDLGNIDTLVAPPDSISGYAKFYRQVGNSLILDSIFRTGYSSWLRKDGYYQTSKITGRSEHTYTLKVVTKSGDSYSAQAFMPKITTLDSIGVGIRYSVKDNNPYKVPRYYFKEPPLENNYYLATTSVFSGVDQDETIGVPVFSQRQCFQALILDDDFLTPYVDGIFVDETCAKDQNSSDKIGGWGNGYLMSLTHQHYSYLKVLFDQLKSDGGAYKPTPANPPTNISNGALGYFGASSVSRKFYKQYR